MADGYPILLRLEGVQVAVIGGGDVATRKVQNLRQAAARVRVVAPDLSPALTALAQRFAPDPQRDGHGSSDAPPLPPIEYRPQTYRFEHLADCRLVIAATNSTAVNGQVLSDAHAAGIWALAADEHHREVSGFHLPAVLRRGALTVAVWSGGAAPALAAAVRNHLADHLETEYVLLADWAATARRAIMAAYAAGPDRTRLLRHLGHPELLSLARYGGLAALNNWLARSLTSPVGEPHLHDAL